MSDPTFGLSLVPTLDVAAHRELARTADENGLEWLGIQDHPYVPRFLDAFVLAGDLLAATSRIHVFPDVANLPLRPPAVLAKTAASLDLVSGGRFDLAVGAGGFWDAIVGMGVERRTRAEANAALEEAFAIMRGIWRGDEPVRHRGVHYTVEGLSAGPAPAHPIELWTGAQGPRALALTGRIADGWAAPIPKYLPYEQWAAANAVLDDAAIAAGRSPAAVRRIAQVVGTITDGREALDVTAGEAPVRGSAAQWTEFLTFLGTELPYTTFVFWPEQQTVDQVLRFARDVVPAVREGLGRA